MSSGFFLFLYSMKIAIINGPNLNMLGKREPEVYGSETFEDYLLKLRGMFPQVVFDYYQSNVEGELINELQASQADGIIMNAGGYTHTSVAIADAIAAISVPVIEVHISNVYAREEYRHESKMAKNCKGVIAGFGVDSYRLAVLAFLNE